MKIRNLLLSVAFVVAAAIPAMGQINPRIFVKPEEWPAILKRPMIVSVMEEDPKVVARLTKKEKKKPGILQAYRDEIRMSNEFVKSGLEKYWKLNQPYEFKSATEVKEMVKAAKKAKTSKYVIFMQGYLNDSEREAMLRTDLDVPALIYFRAEMTEDKPDYKIYISNSYVRESMTFSESDIHHAIITMQDNIAYMKGKKKAVNYDQYVKEQCAANCGKLQGKVLLLDRELISDKVKEQEVKKSYPGEVKVVSHEEVTRAFNEGDENTAYLVCVPYGIIKGTMGPLMAAYLMTAKVAIDCKTKEILNQHEWVKSSMGMTGKMIDAGVRPRNMEGIAKCKD